MFVKIVLPYGENTYGEHTNKIFNRNKYLIDSDIQYMSNTIQKRCPEKSKHMKTNCCTYQWHMLNEKWAGAANDCES